MFTQEQITELTKAQIKLSEILEKRSWFLGCGVGLNHSRNLQLSILIDSSYPDADKIMKEFSTKAIGGFSIVGKLQNKDRLHEILDKNIKNKNESL